MLPRDYQLALDNNRNRSMLTLRELNLDLGRVLFFFVANTIPPTLSP